MRNVGWNERTNTPSICRSKMSDLTGVFAVGTIVVGPTAKALAIALRM